jgi:hypothetical protein
VAPPQSSLVSRAERLNTPAIGDDDLSWLAEFETQDADACHRDSVPIREAAQVSDYLAPRLRTPAADAVWRAASDDENLHRIRNYGLELPFAGGVYPPRYYASTNSIRPEYMSWASTAIQEIRAMGAISTWSDHVRAGYAVGDRPWMVMPLIVQPKPGQPDRFRLIHDCRALNKLLVKLRFKMEALHHFVKQLSYLDKLFSADIESAYHHIEIVPRHRTLLGFSFDGVMYVYNVLPFGLTTSASVFCAFTAVTARALRNSGLVSALIVYVDDFGGSIGHLRDPARMDAVLRIIRSFGWVLSPSKLNIAMECRIKLLGFVLDTKSMTIDVPEGRRAKLRASADDVWKRRACVPVRTICQLAGQIMSMQLAFGLVCRLRSRYLLHAVKDAAQRHDYSGFTALGARAAQEALLFAYQLDTLAPQPMHVHRQAPTFTLHCDASDHAVAAIVHDAPVDACIIAPFYRRLLHHETARSSALRELTGYRDAYRTLRKRYSMHGQVIEIVGDSLCCQYIFDNGGSQAVDADSGLLLLTEVLLDLLTAAADDGAVVRFRWVRRDQVQDADDLSKFIDRMDFSLHSQWLNWVRSTFGPWDIDRFACQHNATVGRFNSLFDSTDSEAVDAMAQDWSQGVSYILPNFHMIDQIMDKVERDNAEVVLIVPEWSHKPWWQRAYSGAWAARLAKSGRIPAGALVPNNAFCFFDTVFTTALLVMRTLKLQQPN